MFVPKGLLNYYMLEGYHHHVQTAVLEATRKFGPDPVLKLYKCLGMLAEGKEATISCSQLHIKKGLFR